MMNRKIYQMKESFQDWYEITEEEWYAAVMEKPVNLYPDPQSGFYVLVGYRKPTSRERRTAYRVLDA